MKLFIVLAIVAFAALCSANPVIKETMYDCYPVEGDKLIFAEHVQVPGTLFEHHYRIVNYPETGEGDKVINCIKIIDHISEVHKEGSTNSIVAGGVNNTFVSIKFESSLSGDIDSDLEIYGQPIKK